MGGCSLPQDFANEAPTAPLSDACPLSPHRRAKSLDRRSTESSMTVSPGHVPSSLEICATTKAASGHSGSLSIYVYVSTPALPLYHPHACECPTHWSATYQKLTILLPLGPSRTRGCVTPSSTWRSLCTRGCQATTGAKPSLTSAVLPLVFIFVALWNRSHVVLTVLSCWRMCTGMQLQTMFSLVSQHSPQPPRRHGTLSSSHAPGSSLSISSAGSHQRPREKRPTGTNLHHFLRQAPEQ